MARKRPFNRESLAEFATPEIRPPMGIGALVWRYLVLVPLKERSLADSREEQIANDDDRETIQTMLVEHFGGLSVSEVLLGYGLRDPSDLGTVEINLNLPLHVYARPIAASDRYFDRLQIEMQEAFDQGVILIERQDALLFGSPSGASVSSAAKAHPARRKRKSDKKK